MRLLERSPNRLINIQYLRAFAALLVLFFHLESGLNGYWISFDHIKLFANAGGIGVAIFYCITGFIVPYSSFSKVRSFSKFLLPKIFRIYPAYIFVTLLVILCIVLLPSYMFDSPKVFDVEKLINSLFFLDWEMYVFVGYTIRYQWIFYIAFAIISYRFDKLIRKPILPLLISLVLWATYITSGPLSDTFSFFSIGFGVFYLISREKINGVKNQFSKINIIIFYTTIFLSIIFNFKGFIIGLIVYLIVFLENFQFKQFKLNLFLNLGNISYSFFLIQVITYPASVKFSYLLINTGLLGDPNYYLFYTITMVLGLISTLIGGLLIYRYIEEPCFKVLMNSSKKF